MNRRAMLRAVGLGTASLGGCARLRSIRSAVSTPTPPPADALRTLSVRSVASGGLPQLGLEPSAAAVEPTVTNERAGKIELVLTNESDRRRTLDYESCPPADEHAASSVDGDARLVLLRSDAHDFDPASAECWRPSGVDFLVGEPCGPAEFVVDAGESLARTYDVWDHPENERCMPPGEYGFGETYRIRGRKYEWGFVVRVDDP